MYQASVGGRSESTTALYAKIDQAALDLAVRPWPGDDPRLLDQPTSHANIGIIGTSA